MNPSKLVGVAGVAGQIANFLGAVQGAIPPKYAFAVALILGIIQAFTDAVHKTAAKPTP